MKRVMRSNVTLKEMVVGCLILLILLVKYYTNQLSLWFQNSFELSKSISNYEKKRLSKCFFKLIDN